MERVYTFDWDDSFDMSVTVRVDTDVLTPDVAHQINNFYSGNRNRLSESDGDIYLCVARMFASYNMAWALENGGEYIGSASDPRAADFVKSTLSFLAEGWPSADKCGLSILKADVRTPDFDSLTLRG